MKHGNAVGSAMILVALLLGAVLAMSLLQWETAQREQKNVFFPTLTPLPAQSPTPLPAIGGVALTGSPAGPGDAAAGAPVFAAKCNGCHPSANAGLGPDVRGPAFGARFPEDGPLEQIVRKGRGGMPGFADLSATDMANLIAYMRSLP